jgi:hypothetical protein
MSQKGEDDDRLIESIIYISLLEDAWQARLIYNTSSRPNSSTDEDCIFLIQFADRVRFTKYCSYTAMT